MSSKKSNKSIVATRTAADGTQVNLTESQADKIAEIKAAGHDVIITKCLRCGKTLIKDTSIENEQGDYCNHLFNELGYTTEALAAHRAAMSSTEVPEDWVKVAALHKICVREGIPVASMVKAMGGDRALGTPLNEMWVPLYVGNARWLDPFCATPEGLDQLRAASKVAKIGKADASLALATEANAPLQKAAGKKNGKIVTVKATPQDAFAAALQSAAGAVTGGSPTAADKAELAAELGIPVSEL